MSYPWKVEVVEFETNKVIKELSAVSKASAEALEDSVTAKLDIDKFYTRIIGPKSAVIYATVRPSINEGTT